MKCQNIFDVAFGWFDGWHVWQSAMFPYHGRQGPRNCKQGWQWGAGKEEK